MAAGETKLNKCIFLGKIKMLMLLHRLSIKSSPTWILLIVNDLWKRWAVKSFYSAGF